jgi:hypothetical protein
MVVLPRHWIAPVRHAASMDDNPTFLPLIYGSGRDGQSNPAACAFLVNLTPEAQFPNF